MLNFSFYSDFKYFDIITKIVVIATNEIIEIGFAKIYCPTQIFIFLGWKYSFIIFIEIKDSPFPIVWVFMPIL
jgi:hypothetical protein